MSADEEPMEEVEVAELSEWTTGYSIEDGAVALILTASDGQRMAVAMPPQMADEMGAALSGLASRFGPKDKA